MSRVLAAAAAALAASTLLVVGLNKDVSNATGEQEEVDIAVDPNTTSHIVGGSNDVTTVSLRVTSIFRPEDSTWKLVHRHADPIPITTPQPSESVIQN